MSQKYVYLFSEGNANMRELLGGKGANLAEMTNLGLPIPQGFTVTTEACTEYYDDGEKISDEEQMFIGNFVTCFPSYDACSIIFRFINDFKMFMMTMYPCNVESFSVIDMIQITRIWMDARNKKKINKLERMK